MKKKLKASGVSGKRVTVGKGLGNRRLSAGMVSESDRISIAAMVFSPLPSTLLCPKPKSLGIRGAL